MKVRDVQQPLNTGKCKYILKILKMVIKNEEKLQKY